MGRNAAWRGTTSRTPPSPRGNGKKRRLEGHNFPYAAVTAGEWEEMPPGGAQAPSRPRNPARPARPRPPNTLPQCAVAVPAPPLRAPRRVATSTALGTSSTGARRRVAQAIINRTTTHLVARHELAGVHDPGRVAALAQHPQEVVPERAHLLRQ